MASQKPRTQKTRPKKGEPIEIPVPERREVLGDLKKLARPTSRRPRK